MKDFIIPYIGPICSVCIHPCYTICLGCKLFVHLECKSCSCKSNETISKQNKLKATKNIKRVKFLKDKEDVETEINNLFNENYGERANKNKEKTILKNTKKNTETTNVLSKSTEISSFDTEILQEILSGEYCTICTVEYSDLDTEMLFCEGCEIWIHRECAGITEKEYINEDNEKEGYFCFKCLFNYCDFCGLKEYKGNSNIYFTDSSPTFTAHKACLSKRYKIDTEPFSQIEFKKNKVNLFGYKKLIKIFRDENYKAILALKTTKFENTIFQKEIDNYAHKKGNNPKIWKDTKIIKEYFEREEYLIKKATEFLKKERFETGKENINFLKNDNPLNFNWNNLIRKSLKISKTEFQNNFNKIHATLFHKNEKTFDFNVFKENKSFKVFYRNFNYLFFPSNIVSFFKSSIEFINYKCKLDEHEIPSSLIPKQYLNILNTNNFPSLNLNNGKVEIKFSKIEGFGAFAKSTLFKDELIDFYGGIEIKHAESDLLEEYYISNDFKDQIYMFSFDSGLRIKDGTLIGNYAKFYNNSCEPNCYAKEISIGHEIELGIFAKRIILKGEELTYKYDLSGEEKIVCKCSSDICIGHL